MLKIFLELNVVDNWNLTQYNLVAASNGSMGVGGGAPLQPWAPQFSSSSVIKTKNSFVILLLVFEKKKKKFLI